MVDDLETSAQTYNWFVRFLELFFVYQLGPYLKLWIAAIQKVNIETTSTEKTSAYHALQLSTGKFLISW